MNEHSGGAPKVAHIPMDSWSEESFELHPIVEPDMTVLDKPKDIILERLQSGEELEAIVFDLCGRQIRLQIAAALRRAMGFVRESNKPRLTADQIDWVSGVALFQGITLGQLAARHGISKQAFQQGAEKIRRPLFQIRSQSARPDKSRSKMRLRNSRRTKHERPDLSSEMQR